MSSCQSLAAWELCRQGYPLSADEAEACWDQGEIFVPDQRTYIHMPLTREALRLIDIANWEITHLLAA